MEFVLFGTCILKLVTGTSKYFVYFFKNIYLPLVKWRWIIWKIIYLFIILLHYIQENRKTSKLIETFYVTITQHFYNYLLQYMESSRPHCKMWVGIFLSFKLFSIVKLKPRYLQDFIATVFVAFFRHQVAQQTMNTIIALSDLKDTNFTRNP